MCVVQEASDNLLNVFFVCFIEFGTVVNWVSCLIALSILDRVWVVGAMLRFRRMWVLKLE